MAGHIFNDIIDVKKDRKLYPHKPIVTGAVPLWLAWLLGIIFIIASGVIAYNVNDGTVLIVLALIGAIFAYDILAKQEKVPSAVVFGICHTLNIYLGASAVIAVPDDILNFSQFAKQEILWIFPAAIGIYIAGVTLVSTLEDMQSSPFKLSVSTFIILIGLVIPPGFKYVQIHLKGEMVPEFWTFSFIVSMALGGALVVVLILVMTYALYEHSPKNLHRIVATGRLGAIWLCASIVASLEMPFTALVLALLIVPAILLYQQLPDPAKRILPR